jgi:glutathione synthase/RimK-type ligase-like ATP-grasp enzyme
MPRVALVTCAELPDLDTDDQLAVEPLRALGVAVETPVWDDPAVDWGRFDLAVLRNPWDYPRRREQFLAWTRSVPRLLNPPAVVQWNTDKVYLRELAAAGLPVVPTTWLQPGDHATNLPDDGEYVVKPSVSAGSADTGRYDLADQQQRGLAEAHAEKLLARGDTVMLQPYLSAVDTAGETAMLHIGGAYSHAIRKGALLDGPDLRDGAPLWSEDITPREASDPEREVARRTLEAIPGGSDQLLYARVDVIPGPDGAPVVLEVELTEPSLFLRTSPGAPERLARAITAQL